MEENVERQLMEQKNLLNQVGIELDALSIHKMDFETKFRGYDPEAVDNFLDTIIKDYQQFYKVTSDLMEKYKLVKIQMKETQHHYETVQRQEPAVQKRPIIDRKFIEDIVEQLERNVDELKYRIQLGYEEDRWTK